MRFAFPRVFRNVPLFYFAAMLTVLAATPVLAQQPPPRPPSTPANDPNDPVNQERTNKADMGNREWLMGNNRKPVRKPGFGPEESAAPQIREDFERIQFINREMMKAVFADNVVDNMQILKTISEIKKRASRLRTNLAYPEPDSSQTGNDVAIQNEAEIRLSLARLDRSIMSFVMNPIFQLQQHVVEAELAKKAMSDLRDVVDLSDRIRKTIEKLKQGQ